MRRGLWLILLAALLALPGCARRVPAARLAEEGGDVEIRLLTRSGEELSGALVRLTREELVVDVESAERGDAAIVRRTIPIREVERAEFARSRREATLGTLLSQVVGPAVGILLGLLVQG